MFGNQSLKQLIYYKGALTNQFSYHQNLIKPQTNNQSNLFSKST